MDNLEFNFKNYSRDSIRNFLINSFEKSSEILGSSSEAREILLKILSEIFPEIPCQIPPAVIFQDLLWISLEIPSKIP